MKKIFFLLLIIGQKVVYGQTEMEMPTAVPITYLGVSKKMTDIQHPGNNEKDAFVKIKQHEDEERNMENISANKNIKVIDEALQTTFFKTEATGLTILDNYEGLKSNYLRSDNNIAVGPDHVVQIINTNYLFSYLRVWNKSGDILIDKISFLELSGFFDYGDPNIIYDEQADRWVISFLFSGTDNKLRIAASQTSDPTGAWFMYVFDTPAGFPDYEKLAVWGDSYIITIAANKPAKPAVYVLNRAEILSGTLSSPVLMFQPQRVIHWKWQGLAPINVIGSAGVPEDEPAIIARVVDDAWFGAIPETDQMELFELNINWDAPLTSTMSGPLDLPIDNYNSDLCGFEALSCLPQQGSETKLWPLSNFITDKSKYMNFGTHQSIVATHICNADGEGTAGIRWYELRKYPAGEWFVYQQGTYAPDDDHRFISSISINAEGSIALGYNITGETLFPGMRVVGRAACDPLNLMTTSEAIFKEGTSPNQKLDYGDYNGIVTDPVDGSFWFTAQYNKSPKWSTNMVHFTIDGCPEEFIEKEKPELESVRSITNIQLSPNPAVEQILLSFVSNNKDLTNIEIFNMNGELMFTQNFKAEKGFNSLNIEIKHFPVTNYLLSIRCNIEKNVKSFSISR